MIIRIIFTIFCSAACADCFLMTGCCASAMFTVIAAFLTYTIFPFMLFCCNTYEATAIPFLLVCISCLNPLLCSRMIARIQISITISTNLTLCFFCTSCFAAAALCGFRSVTAICLTFPDMHSCSSIIMLPFPKCMF